MVKKIIKFTVSLITKTTEVKEITFFISQIAQDFSWNPIDEIK